jgi:mono/diheme cytochrome c family protein
MVLAMSWVLGYRRRILFVTLLVLAALDAARSVYARIAYREPNERWEPAPEEYASLSWPPGSMTPDQAPLGQRIFAKHCATCHGPDGRGNGPAAPSMSPSPRDFTLGEFKYKSTASGTAPTEADLIRTVKNGLHASAMPYFSDILNDDEIRAVVQHIRTLSPPQEDPVPVEVVQRAPETPESVARGKELYSQLGCEQCHGADYRGGNPYEVLKGRPVIARDLTAPWTFRGGSEPEELWLRLTVGMTPGPMPSYETAATPEQRWDLVNFVLSLARTPPWAPGGKLGGPGQDPELLRRGDYLVHFEMCGLCHTQINRSGIYREEEFLAGGMRVGAYPHGVFISRNLTSDSTGLGAFTPEQIAETIRNGRRFDRTLNPWGMPWWFLHNFTEQDALGIATYLKSLPPVRNAVPGPLNYGVAETVVVKLTRPLPGANPRLLSYADGNFGQPGQVQDARDSAQRWLIKAQYWVLIIGALLFLFPRASHRRWRRSAKSWIKAFFLTLALALLVLAGWVIYGLPTLIPPEPLSQAVTSGVPEPALSSVANERGALVKRGRYLFTVSSCIFCHGNNGRGGSKISWKPFGTLWSRNITSDIETGIGGWSDEQIARAIRSGVSRDGRQLHWQGMTWDLLSNMDEEDVRAVIAYLRTLPPVKNAIPDPRLPAIDDCEIYSFFVSADIRTPGCQ